MSSYVLTLRRAFCRVAFGNLPRYTAPGYAPYSPPFFRRGALLGGTVEIRCDDEASDRALVRGGSDLPPVAASISQFWSPRGRRTIAIWIDRVSSGGKLPDLPTRGRKHRVPLRGIWPFSGRRKRLRTPHPTPAPTFRGGKNLFRT